MQTSRRLRSSNVPRDRRLSVHALARIEDPQGVDAITKEITALSESMRADLQAADKGIAAAGALIVAGLGIALLQRATIVLVALPYGLGVVFFYTLQKYAERLSSAGIRAYLEEILHNAANGSSPIMQQQVADYWRQRRSDEKVAYLVYGIVIAASLATSLYVADHQSKLSSSVPLARWLSARHDLVGFSFSLTGLAYIDVAFLVILLIALYFPYRTMSRAYDIAHQRATALYHMAP